MPGNSRDLTFLFLSQILGKKIVDPKGRPVGKLCDLVANIADPCPLITGVLFLSKAGEKPSFSPWQRIIKIGESLVVHPIAQEDLHMPSMREGEILLKDSLLDKQVVDAHGAKVLRVNDLHLMRINLSLRLVHVDVGFRGLMRRVGLEKAMDKFFQWFFDYHLPDHFIPWKYVQPLSSRNLLRLKIAQNLLSQLHPADLADIVEDLDIHKRADFFKSLDVGTAAEMLEETDPKIQVRLIEDLNPSRASDIIEEMSTSEAADLLGDLPKDKAEGILKEMEKEVAEDVKELLVHPEEKAGGLMTSSFPCLPPSATAGEAINMIRVQSEELDLIYYLYVADEEGHLLGVISLRELLGAAPQNRLADLMIPRIICVSLESEKDQIADLFAKYGLKALPVVDEANRIKGVITFKSLLEVVAPHLGK